MKFSFSAIAALTSVIIFSGAVQSKIQGSDHDLTGSGRKLCEACHTSHNALGEALWSSNTVGYFSGMADLCYSCHDGSITDVGITTVFDQEKEQHIMVGEDCSGSGSCHDVHSQNPNKTGRFLIEGITRTNNSYCETCHDETPFEGAEHLGVHNTSNSHYTNGTTFICESCHTNHGAVKQTVNPPDLTNPILLADDNVGYYYGEFCISCHKGIPPPEAVPGTGGVASNDIFDYTETRNDGTQSKHTTHSGLIDGCGACHVPMCADAPALELYDLRENNTNSSFCVSCHSSGGAPHVGDNTHFSQAVPNNNSINAGLSPPLPWSNEIDEDGNPGPDWPSATANMMTCQTCHSVHRHGFTGVDAGYLLRYPDDKENTMCQACHSQN